MDMRKTLDRFDTALVVVGLPYFLFVLVRGLVVGDTHWSWLVTATAFALYCAGYLFGRYALSSMAARVLVSNSTAIVSGIALIFTFIWFGITFRNYLAFGLSMAFIFTGAWMAFGGIRRIDAWNRSIDA